MDILEIAADDFQRDFARYQDLALRQPVAVTREGRDSTVLIAADEYARLKRRDRRVLGLADFSDAEIAALEASRPPVEAKAFDDELSP